MKKIEKKKDYTIHVGLQEEDHEAILEMAKEATIPKSTMARILLKEALGKRKQSDVLKRLQENADRILAKETPELINEWLNEQRRKEALSNRKKK